VSFVPVCPLADLPVGEAKAYEVNGVPVALVRTEEGVFAIYDECSHAAVPLSEGWVEDCTLECYLHGSRFDLRTGAPLELPAVTSVPVYPVQITADQVAIDLAHPLITEEDQES
jgi:3-phenylpropionate/trans-cinnamate dioxygenase ferredoxin subunit